MNVAMDETWTESKRVKVARRIAYQRQLGLCHWCHEPMIFKTQANASAVWNHPRVCTADHVLWRCRGGRTTEDNIVAACLECNTKRQPPPPEATIEWPWLRELLTYTRKHTIR
jgi:hypothetical protein